MTTTNLNNLTAMTNSGAAIRYETYAFRESSRGLLEGTFQQISGDPEAPHTVIKVEPFVNKKGEFDRALGFEAAALLTAGAWFSRRQQQRPGYYLKFADRFVGAPGQLAAWEPERGVTTADAQVEITREITLTGEALNVWLDTPAERAATYLQWFAQVSADVQTALRRWLPYLLLRDAEVFREPGLAGSLLFYAATRPYLARVRGRFTYDIICPESLASVYRSGTQNLAGVMERAQAYAAAAGRTDLVERFAPSEMRGVLIQVRRDGRALKNLLALENKLIESLLAIGEKGHALEQSNGAPKNLHRFCAQWARGLQTRLRRVLGHAALPQLTDLVLLEGTASLARCIGLRPERKETTSWKAVQEADRPVDFPWAA